MNVKKNITFWHSPDADDAFMFYGFHSGIVNLQDYEIKHQLQDIQTLNNIAIEKDLDITAISVAAYPHLYKKYQIMSCGSSIGRNYGPVIVAKENIPVEELKNITLACPGILTTAWALYTIYFEQPRKVIFADFDKITKMVSERQVEAGIILHEDQLLYKEYGLEKIVDLGSVWYADTGLPIPLGVDVISRKFEPETRFLLAKAFKTSILHALSNRKEAVKFALQFGRGIREDMADKFIGMYVNQDTVNMGEEGKIAIETLYKKLATSMYIAEVPSVDILTI